MFFDGPFAPMCKLFISQRRALGVQCDAEYWLLRSFDNFCKNYDVQDYALTKEIAQAWFVRRPNEGENHRTSRIREMQRFAEFLRQQGFDSYIMRYTPPKHTKHTPYIFSHSEMSRIFEHLDQMEFSPWSPSKHLNFPLFYRMLYGCGLRVSEALNLLLCDVDVKTEVIHVRHGKNDNERLVPMSASLVRHCSEFISAAHSGHGLDHPFYFRKDGDTYTVSNIDKHFRDLLWEVGIPYRGKDLGPRVHDIRHTFVCHRLNQWASDNADLLTLLPVLSKYIGHVSMAGTEWYLRLTAEAYSEVRAKMDALTGCVFPEVRGELL
jgi:integrase